ncbi:MAG: GyrI-like domain-containing protein [Actinomycetes bacterium]
MEYEIRIVDVEAQPAAVVRGEVGLAAIGQFVGDAFARVMQVAAAQGLAITGAPFGRFEPRGDTFGVAAGFPVSQLPVGQDGVEPIELPAGPTAQVMHQGPYDGVSAAYRAIEEWGREHDYEASAPPWECYLDGPEVPEPRTLVVAPCRPRVA